MRLIFGKEFWTSVSIARMGLIGISHGPKQPHRGNATAETPGPSGPDQKIIQKLSGRTVASPAHVLQMGPTARLLTWRRPLACSNFISVVCLFVRGYLRGESSPSTRWTRHGKSERQTKGALVTGQATKRPASKPRKLAITLSRKAATPSMARRISRENATQPRLAQLRQAITKETDPVPSPKSGHVRLGYPNSWQVSFLCVAKCSNLRGQDLIVGTERFQALLAFSFERTVAFTARKEGG
ncbi:uncharacterized protein LY79DRAFT_416586 [Colletotrichum navitas]|uniref:Uncharacterized protein n=1 Tax=Colletotrichum navitas TaxID=681940 RepID=A0AAD8PNX0_9PEZI|nr:uncharacterized protein LY79DRAFT_416586 [Colletotrichum navitas]KAK1573201.1 hypothetical protein LY79DRAFT_416586 [Colletotrichum navitas]